jgi:hypothetical protein
MCLNYSYFDKGKLLVFAKFETIEGIHPEEFGKTHRDVANALWVTEDIITYGKHGAYPSGYKEYCRFMVGNTLTSDESLSASW